MMAEHHENNGPLEVGAPMDYSEHEKTFAGFVKLAKYGTLACVAIMIAMAAFFFATSGGLSGFITMIIVFAAVFILGAITL
jgi:hypothetical protein